MKFSATLLVASIAGDNRRKPLEGCFIVVFCSEPELILGIVILHSGWIATGKAILSAETAISAWQESSQWLCSGLNDARTAADEARHEFSQSPPGKAGFRISSDTQVVKAYPPTPGSAAWWLAIRDAESCNTSILTHVTKKAIVAVKNILFLINNLSARAATVARAGQKLRAQLRINTCIL